MAPPRRGETKENWKMQSARGKHVQKVQKQQLGDDHAHVHALSKAQAISYYDMDGVILDVNERSSAAAWLLLLRHHQQESAAARNRRRRAPRICLTRAAPPSPSSRPRGGRNHGAP